MVTAVPATNIPLTIDPPPRPQPKHQHQAVPVVPYAVFARLIPTVRFALLALTSMERPFDEKYHCLACFA